MGVITVEGIRVFAYHGDLPEEAKLGGHFIVSVWVVADTSEVSLCLSSIPSSTLSPSSGKAPLRLSTVISVLNFLGPNVTPSGLKLEKPLPVW